MTSLRAAQVFSKQRSYWLRCFLKKSIQFTALAGATALVPAVSFSQVACINGEEHRPCTPAEATEMLAFICKNEPAPANLFVTQTAQVGGAFFDETNAPFEYKGRTSIQLRETQTGRVLREVHVNAKGEFHLGVVEVGNYRLIVIYKRIDGTPERPGTFDQPKRIDCSGQNPCVIRQVLHVHGTDNPVDQCPPK